MAWVTVNGAEVRMREEEGPRGGTAVVLLHMAGGASSTWGPVAGMLGRRARVVVPDYPAHGQSHPAALPAAPPSLLEAGISPRVASLAAWVLQLMDAADIPRAVLCGHSMGGAVALCAARLAPERVSAVGVVCTAAHLVLAPDVLGMLEHDPEIFARRFTDAALPVGADAAVGLRVRPIFPQAPLAEVVADFAAVDGLDLRAVAAGLRVPAVVLGGMMDTLTPPGSVRALAGALPRARLVLVEGAGHMLPREQPARVATELASLLGS